MHRHVLFSLLFVFSLSCSSSEPRTDEAPTEKPASTEPAEEPAEEPQTEPMSQAMGETVVPTAEQIETRVAASKNRLNTTEGGKMVWQAIETHGGLERWFANGPISFRFNYEPVDGTARDTYQVVDQWASRAVQELASDRSIKFGWNGEKAWHTKVEGEFPLRAPRFWALTPYYFVGVPFVFADPGSRFEVLKPKPFEGTTYDRVKVTFTEGTGDAPDDYYIVYLDQKTRQVGGVTYIVSYPGFFPDGGSSDPKFMSYDGSQKVGGLVFAESYRTFALDENGKPGEVVTNTKLTEVSFEPEVTDDYFAIPEDAVVIEGY